MDPPADETAAEPAPEEAATDGAAEAAAPAPRRRKKKARRARQPETFAGYLALLHEVDHGFHAGAVEEIAELAAACDHVLTCRDGDTFTIVCILDAERDAERAFSLSADRLQIIALRCLEYTGSAEGKVVLRVVEVREAIRPEDRERLSGLCRENRSTALASVDIRACLLGRRDGEVWSNLGMMQERWYRRALTSPRREAAELVPRAPPEAPKRPATVAPAPPIPTATPWLTGSIMALTVLLFVAELTSGVGASKGLASPSFDTLVAMGGVSRALVVEQGEWWRLFTAPLLHAGVMHLVLNGVGLFLGGLALETLFGRAWLGAVFVLGALGGSLASIAINDPGMVSVGASGAIMGLLAAALVASYRAPPVQRTQIQVTMARLLVPSLIPIATSRTGEHVDFAAHLGGAAVGAALGLALLATWPKGERLPRFRFAAAALAVAGAAVYLVGMFHSASAYAGYRDAATIELMPQAQLDTIDTANPDVLLARYPRDPRAHWLAASRAAKADDLPAAEKHLRAALSEEALLRRSFPNRKLEAALRGMLARVLDAQGRHAEALSAARPVCDVGAPEIEPYCRE